MSCMQHIVRSFRGREIAVLGDLMLDRYTCGHATRISQEAPVPVVLVQSQNDVPGGAANVARNILSLGGTVIPLGFAGNDADGDILVRLLADAGADTGSIASIPGGVTTVKTRVMAARQQVVRIDREYPSQITPAMRASLLEALDRKLASGNCMALIMEDYAKGVFDRDFMLAAVETASRHGVLTTLDPHPSNTFNVPGLRLMTPNRREAFTLAGIPYVSGIGDPLNDQALLNVGARLQELWNPELLLITLGSEGMLLFDRSGGRPVVIDTVAQRVFDVSGAGDTVMATMTMALAVGAAPEEAARIANQAAGIVVGYVGTRAIEADELLERL
ncbi:MAG: hypothetical protein J6S21_04920 [Victivallales bacterium]|nr:hypothetical protein [Victivallales bacterium]